jgi:hypothetical protein
MKDSRFRIKDSGRRVTNDYGVDYMKTDEF